MVICLTVKELIGRSLAGQQLGMIGFGMVQKTNTYRARSAFRITSAYYASRRAALTIELWMNVNSLPLLDTVDREVETLSLQCRGGEAQRHLVGAALLAWSAS